MTTIVARHHPRVRQLQRLVLVDHHRVRGRHHVRRQPGVRREVEHGPGAARDGAPYGLGGDRRGHLHLGQDDVAGPEALQRRQVTRRRPPRWHPGTTTMAFSPAASTVTRACPVGVPATVRMPEQSMPSADSRAT